MTVVVTVPREGSLNDAINIIDHAASEVTLITE